MSSSGTSMGDLFNQRRAAARKPASSSNNSKRPPSFLEIQAEQGAADRYSTASRSRRPSNHHHRNFPIEQGAIAALKDSFGFIHCADREDRLFFHFSQVRGCHPADLRVHDEVEFGVGTARNREGEEEDKLAAYNVKQLEQGTIEWEYQEEPGERYQGLVERPVRGSDARGGPPQEGTIRMLLAPEVTSSNDERDDAPDDKDQPANVGADASGPLVRFRAPDYEPSRTTGTTDNADGRTLRRFDSMNSTSSSSSRGGRLNRNDLVEFTLVTERRSGNKFARSITLIQSDRERQRVQKEKELLENATLERGIVTALRNDFGFLRSNKRREEVYFHYSNVVLPDDEEEEKEEAGAEDFTLKEGQEMEFLVVTEPGSGGRKERLSARKVDFLPSGSVVFHTVLAEGVTGMVMQAPHPADSGYSIDMVGSVHLWTPIECKAEDGTTVIVKDALLYATDAPGGSFAKNMDGSAVGMWVRQGDTVLFDLVRETVDGSYRVSPTKHICPVKQKSSGVASKSEESALVDNPKAVRLTSISLAGRAEGVIRAVKDGYGFIHCTERPVDAYFRLYELLPEQIQHDLRGNLCPLQPGNGDDKLELKVGSEVQFDLSIKGTIAMGGSRSRKGQGERENLKAQRILLLPPGTIVDKKVIATGVRGVVAKEDAKQTYSGSIELEETYQPMSIEERHPLVAKMVQGILKTFEEPEVASHPIVFHDIQSAKDDEVVVDMVERLGQGKLSCSHIPVSSQPLLPGRLVISSAATRQGPADKDAAKDEESKEQASLHPERTGSELAKSVGPSAMLPRKGGRKKKHHSLDKPIKLVHFDKHCLIRELRDGEELPPAVGDVIECDVVQSRRSGGASLESIRVVERGPPVLDAKLDESSGIGVISEVVSARQFGFIAVLDENASKREMLFFQLSNVASDASSKGRAPAPRKGDEVKFEISRAKNGKRSAVDIHILPRGSLNIKTKADKNACRGFVMMEPSHTSMANTPSRQASSVGKLAKASTPGSRWQNVDTTSDLSRHKGQISAKEGGCILLIEDPTNLFASKPSYTEKKGQTATEATAETDMSHQGPAPQTSADGDMKPIAKTDSAHESEPSDALSDSRMLISAVGSHVSFKLGAIALQGSSVSAVGDGSSGPRRGDLVSFVKAKNGRVAREIRVETRGAATRLRGRLEEIAVANIGDTESPVVGTAKFHALTQKEEVYDVDLSEVVSCDASILKDKESVEGILHDGKIFGICRTCDLYLESKLGTSHGERPRLNLTVRKELKDRGGKIMAQSMMANGPDGTFGFKSGWTPRISKYTSSDDERVVVPEEQLTGSAPVEGGEST